ncbi:hypothetical protein D3C84_743100 [compost metagenome]
MAPFCGSRETSAPWACGIWLNFSVLSAWRCTRIRSPTWATSEGCFGLGPMLLVFRNGRAHFMLSQPTCSLPVRVSTCRPFLSTWVTMAGSRLLTVRCLVSSVAHASRVLPGRRDSGPR